jgi:colanic acid biosynthesis glycosyl transferase WcaI
MRILIYGINYTPEFIGIGKYTGEMAEWLVTQGYQVRVVTAPPYYPTWKVGKGYSAWFYRYEQMAGVEVWRCPLWVPRQPSGLKRILHLASFAISSLPIILRQGLFWQPDIVFFIEPPFFCMLGALLAARLGGAKAWLHIQDFELDAAFELGLLSSSRGLRKLATVIEFWLMSQPECVSTISEHMLKELATKGVDGCRSLLFPNWVDVNAILPTSENNPFRDELGITSDTIVVLYSGNLGEKQGLEILIMTASLLSAHSNIYFVICGSGSSKKRLMELARSLPNICFLDLQPVKRLNALLNLANIHLLPIRAEAAESVMPSKLKGMFASGRPVIATAHPGTQIANLVEGHGIVVPPGDVTAMSDAILHLADHPEKCTQLGQAAREFAVTHWHKEKILEQFKQKASHFSREQREKEERISSTKWTRRRV